MIRSITKHSGERQLDDLDIRLTMELEERLEMVECYPDYCSMWHTD